MIGTTLASIIWGGKLGHRLWSSHSTVGAVVGSVSGFYVGLAASIWMNDIVERDRVVYRAP
jgi:hypothetical protein